jgi:hypothetical protein
MVDATHCGTPDFDVAATNRIKNIAVKTKADEDQNVAPNYNILVLSLLDRL